MQTFQLRFPAEDLPDWAGPYSAADDHEAERAGLRARDRGYFTRDEFVTVCRWKSPRRQDLFSTEPAVRIAEVTGVALSCRDEHLRIGALMVLSGVAMKTASALLHLAHRDPYPLLDFRALWSLGVETSSDSLAMWDQYVAVTRDLAAQSGLTMRELDRALWKYSEMNQRAPHGLACDDRAA